MKYAWALFVVGLGWSMLGAAPVAADALFAQGEWQAALLAYEEEAVPQTPGVCVRMGECAHALKEYPRALAYWYEALQGLYFLLYYDIALRIVKLEAQLGLGFAAVTPAWILATAAASIPPLVWQVLALLVALFFLLRVRRWWMLRAWYTMLGVLLSIVILGGIAWASATHRIKIGAIATATAPLLSGPDSRFSEVGMLSLGSAVVCLASAQVKEGPLYYKVQSGQRRGWVQQEKLIIIGQKTKIQQ